jgi:hypothetical protein
MKEICLQFLRHCEEESAKELVLQALARSLMGRLFQRAGTV